MSADAADGSAMSTVSAEPDLDRLYRLLPAIHRMRDAEQGYPLQALLRVISEQVEVVEDDVAQLYENWFVETAAPWAVPYIADLIGFRPIAGTADHSASWRDGGALERVLVPRREVANTIRYRRRKGTLALLELLAEAVADWPARSVEFFRLLRCNQNIDHLRLDRGRTVDVREMDALDLIGGPFERLAHMVDVRRVDAHRTRGRENIPSVGVFVWRLTAFGVTHFAPYCVENAGPHCFTFSALGQDAPLFVNPARAGEPTAIAGELDVPAPIRRRALLSNLDGLYGEGRSFAIWAGRWGGHDPKQPVPADAIISADLSDWRYVPPPRHLAVDPVLGRFVFPRKSVPKNPVRVSYHYGFSDNIGGGEYRRTIPNPPVRADSTAPRVYTVGAQGRFKRISAALSKWRSEAPRDAVIELTESRIYVEPIAVALEAGRSLRIRAGNGVRPMLRLLDWQNEFPDALTVTMEPGSQFMLDGLLIAGRGVSITGPPCDDPAQAPASICGAEVVIRHCTLVPGWGLRHDCEPSLPAEPSLVLTDVRATVRVEHAILGSIQVYEQRRTDPIPMRISDSIVDATSSQLDAIGGGGEAARVVLTMLRCTTFGIVHVQVMALAENCIFGDCVSVARRQLGCLRFCHVPRGCRTPRRYRCQPDMVVQQVLDTTPASPPNDATVAAEVLRVTPQFTSRRYGLPGYGQLALTCAEEIKRGADDESEMGVFHDLFEPQRADGLETRLDEYTPTGMDVGIIFVT
jgi:hypothetical protein